MASINSKEASCKLCLKAILDTNFKIIDDLIKDILDVLLLKLKFEEGSKHLICSYCEEKLNAALKFKSTCVNTDNIIIPYMDSEKILQLDLIEIYMTENKTQQLTGISEDQKVCRLCMQLVKNDFRYIHEEEVVTIQKLIPEMNINIVKDPIVCNQCFGFLTTHECFLKECFEVDEKIGNICDNLTTENQTNDELPVDLFVKTEFLDEEWEINEIDIPAKVEPSEIKLEENEGESDTILHSEPSDGKITNKHNTNVYRSKQKNSLNMYKCDKCVFKTKIKHYLLQHHVKYTDSPEVPDDICDDCHFKNHHLVHKDFSEVQIYKCDSYDFQSNYKNSHQLKNKDFSEVRMYKCDACDYITKHKYSLINHQVIHKDFSEVQVYNCDACDYRTKRKGDLINHQLRHKDFSEVPVHKCDACDYRTKSKRSLNRHKVKHKDFSEVQMYKCCACNFKTKYKRNLIRHRLVHIDFLKGGRKVHV